MYYKSTEERYLNNRNLLKILELAIESFPEWRFHQILQNLDYTFREGGDMFFEESSETFNRVNQNKIANNLWENRKN